MLITVNERAIQLRTDQAPPLTDFLSGDLVHVGVNLLGGALAVDGEDPALGSDESAHEAGEVPVDSQFLLLDVLLFDGEELADVLHSIRVHFISAGLAEEYDLFLDFQVGLEVVWSAYHGVFQAGQAHVLDLEGHNFVVDFGDF